MNYFSDIPHIGYEGPDSDNPLAFRHYQAEREVRGKTMAEHLRIAVCYWHSFCWGGSDVFGADTFQRPWLAGPQDQAAALQKLDAAFEFMTKLGAPYFCFHDVDIMAAADTPKAHRENLQAISEPLAKKIQDSGLKLLWGTANLFSHPRYMAGAATNPDPEVFAVAASQVRQMLDLTHQLNGENYVLWGGREGYDTLLNTSLDRELDQLGRFLNLVVEHKHKIGFTGTILIEPKPHEPTKHQYDHDVATVYGFLERYELQDEVKVNIEANHATLSGHSFEHEVCYAQTLGVFGSIDMNRGDPQNGWDTDQFPNSVPELAMVLYEILRHGGFSSGGFNFDAKLRRQSIDPDDLFYAHIGAMDALAQALIMADQMLEARELEAFRQQRYQAWDGELGQSIFAAKTSLESLDAVVDQQSLDPRPISGRQEFLENWCNRFIK